MSNRKFNLWAEEIGPGYAQRWQIIESLFTGRSEFQQVDLVRTTNHGVMLFLDSLAMASERDEFIYHDMISHVPLFVHPDPRRVLIIGGGDGGTAREVLRHEGVEECWNIEIDGMVVESCRQFMQQTACSFDHPKMRLLIEDGVKFMAETKERFDVIMIDSTDPIGAATPLFGEEFYANVFRVLSDDGIMVAQAESTYREPIMQNKILECVGKSFPKVHLYNYANLTYPAGPWSFSFASKGLCPLKDYNPQRAMGMKFKYYNPETHRAAFGLSQFQKDAVGEHLTSWD